MKSTSSNILNSAGILFPRHQNILRSKVHDSIWTKNFQDRLHFGIMPSRKYPLNWRVSSRKIQSVLQHICNQFPGVHLLRGCTLLFRNTGNAENAAIVIHIQPQYSVSSLNSNRNTLWYHPCQYGLTSYFAKRNRWLRSSLSKQQSIRCAKKRSSPNLCPFFGVPILRLLLIFRRVESGSLSLWQGTGTFIHWKPSGWQRIECSFFGVQILRLSLILRRVGSGSLYFVFWEKGLGHIYNKNWVVGSELSGWCSE